MDTRLILTIMMGLTVLPQIHAIGLASFTDYSGGFVMDQGDAVNLEFVLRGDDVQKDNVVFFIEAENNSLSFNGENRYERDYNLDEYEDVNIVVKMRAIEDGTFVVSYGFIEEQTDGGFGISSIVENTFEVEITRVDEEDNDFEVVVDATSSSSSSGRSGGGRGGSSSAQTFSEEEVVGDGEEDVVEARSGVEVIAQDVSAGESATNEIIATEKTSQNSLVSSPLSGNDSARQFMIFVLVIGFLAVISTFGAATYMNREGSE